VGQKFYNSCVAVTGNFLDTLENEQIEQLFQDNLILLDGDAIIVLNRRNLLDLIDATDIEVLKIRSGNQSFEQFDERRISGINNPRITMLTHTGDYVRVNYH